MCANVGLVFLVLVSVTSIEGQEGERIRLKLQNGEIEGRVAKTVDEGKTYYSFQGIPYAKPPLENLRFEAPQPAENWTGIRDATKLASICIEMYGERGNEDCLYLNVYTPSLDKSLPVIIWLPGGAFIFVITSFSLNGADFFMDEEVIVVTVNYRLGVFGFISTEDDVIPGNYGLKDQVMAINWVHENIAAFGGDPNKVTIMGQSAGAVSASYLGMVPHLKGKIHGIIQQSGSCLNPFSLGRYQRTGAFVVSTEMGLQTSDSSQIVEYLRKADAVSLRNASRTTYIDLVLGMGPFTGILYTPGLEPRNSKDPLLTEMPYEQLKKGHFTKIPRMIGLNSMEGLYMIDTEFGAMPSLYNNYDQNIRRYIPVDMNTRNEHVGKLIRRYYMNDRPFLSNLTNALHFGTDDQYVRGILKDARLVSKYSTTYLYQFSYEGKLGNPNREMRGVGHGEEVEYLFHNEDHGQISDEDRKIRKKLVRLWSNFAKHSNPTPNKEKILDNQIWLPINPRRGHTNYMDIRSTLVPSLNPHQKDVDFWDHLYSTYGNPPFDTY
uniref:Carboxylic ester hydrolase n=1 Tax=Holotrichia parallela TaxID=93412 RepID=A0A6G7SK21_HOLPA|nr:carboxylesterase 3 [Holotrichia parallela]